MHLLGTSGTVTTLAGVHLNLARYDRRRIDGVWMSDADLTATIARLLGMSYQERASNNCISVERADLVLAGCAILDAIRNAFPLPRLRVADRGLREGMLVEMMREDGALGRMPIGAPAFDVLEPRIMAKDTTGRLHVTVKSARQAQAVLKTLAGAAAQRSLCGAGQAGRLCARARPTS